MSEAASLTTAPVYPHDFCVRVEALARRVIRFEIGSIERTPHQILRGLDKLEVRIVEVREPQP